jgi:hypothetical protein
MAKKSSRKKNGQRGRDVSAALMMLIPAVLAAFTAFMNALVAKDSGVMDAFKLGKKKGKGSKAA